MALMVGVFNDSHHTSTAMKNGCGIIEIFKASKIYISDNYSGTLRLSGGKKRRPL
jgi:hypothetical protein